ncbi:MAG: hypothetical protein ACLP9L_11310 [Thermoguttaceae bacterium]
MIEAAILAFLALGIWAVFLRPVPRRTTRAVIAAKTFKPAGEYWQWQAAGDDRNFRTPTRIPIAECYVFTLRADDLPGDVIYGVNTIAANAFEVGQAVEIQYQKRALPGIWRRYYVLDMKPL